MPPLDLAVVPMARIAVVAPQARLRDVLAVAASAGCVDLDPAPEGPEEPDRELDDLLRRATGPLTPRLAARAPVLAELEDAGRWDLIAGEAELRRHLRASARHGPVAAVLGWVPGTELDALRLRLQDLGAAVVTLPRPRGAEPPTLLSRHSPEAFRPLVETYGTVRYGDIDPTTFAGLSYVVMFGMMFGDVGHGLVLAVLGLLARRWGTGRLRQVWPLITGAGMAAAGFGLAYGEAFGPTGLVPTLWLNPLEEPVRLLVAAGLVGAVLIAISYGIGTVNRWRESGPEGALLAASGGAGATVYVGLGLVAAGWALGWPWAFRVAAGVVGAGVLLLLVGLLRGAEPGGGRVAQAIVELFDALVRITTNAISFTRLAAFGLTHAAIGEVVWSGTTGLWGATAAGPLAAVLVFAVGNVFAFALEALVVGVQALRLEYYELFSRIYAGEGRPFRPWILPVEEAT